MPPRRLTAGRRPARSPHALPLPLVVLFATGHLAAYLLPTVVGRLSGGLGLTPAQAGAVGSALLLSSASAGLVWASRVGRFGPVRLSRCGLALITAGFGTAAWAEGPVLLVAGCLVGGFGSGTATAVAGVGIAGRPDPHRVSVAGLLTVSATAGVLYLVLPHLGDGHALPFAAIACAAVAALPVTERLAPAFGPGDRRAGEGTITGRGTGTRTGAGSPLPFPVAGAVLAVSMACWSSAQNALWGTSGRIGTEQVGLSESTLGAVFAVALAGGLAGVSMAGTIGSRLGRAAPIGVGTVLIAACVAVSASAETAAVFAVGEVLWNTVYPVVLSYLIGLAASLDAGGRWAVLAGSASSLGVACGPVVGTVLSTRAGFAGMGSILAVVLLVVSVPLTAVVLHVGGRIRLPGAVRARGGAPAAPAGTAGAPAGSPPEPASPALAVEPIEVDLASAPVGVRPSELAVSIGEAMSRGAVADEAAAGAGLAAETAVREGVVTA